MKLFFCMLIFIELFFSALSFGQEEEKEILNTENNSFLSAQQKGIDFEKVRKDFIEANTLSVEDSYNLPENPLLEGVVSKESIIEVDAETLPTGPLPKIELIVDSSGSMGQLLNGDKTKMYFAKKLLSRYLIDQWRERALVGMRVYGSRRKNDCNDNFLSINFKENSLDKIARQIHGLLPTGRTPLHVSIEKAVEDLKDYPGPKRIVVFTDGKETCGGDPCKFVKKIDVDIQIYVVAIGFSPDSEGYDQINCMGQTFPASDEGEFLDSMSKVSNQMKNQNNLSVKSPDPLAVVALFRWENGKRKFFKYFTAAWATRVPPGTYEAEVYLNPKYRFPKFTIPPHKKVNLTVQGKGTLLIKFAKGLLNADLLDKNGNAVHKLKSDRRFRVYTGRYTLHIYREPFFSHQVKNFLIFPEGNHEHLVGDAGSVQFNHPEVAGYYVYDAKDKLMGNFVTNVPIVLPTGNYKFFLNNDCLINGVSVDAKYEVKHVECPQ